MDGIFICIGTPKPCLRLNRLAAGVYSVVENLTCLKKGASFFKKEKAPAASLFSRKQGLGVPMHIKMSSILIDIYYYTLLLLLISIILIAY